MRTFDCLLRVALIGAGLLAVAPSVALVGSTTEGKLGPPPKIAWNWFSPANEKHWLPPAL